MRTLTRVEPAGAKTNALILAGQWDMADSPGLGAKTAGPWILDSIILLRV